MNYWKNGTIVLTASFYVDLWCLLLFLWFTFSIGLKKFQIETYAIYGAGWKALLNSTFFICYFTCLVVVIDGAFALSRIHIFGTFVIFLMLECILCWLYHRGKGSHSADTLSEKKGEVKPQRISARLLIADFSLFNAGFFIINFLKSGEMYLTTPYAKLLFFYASIWVVLSFLTRKYDKDTAWHYFNAIAACLKTTVFVSCVMSIILFAMRLQFYSRTQVFGTAMFTLICEVLLYFIYAGMKKEKAGGDDIELLKHLKKSLLQTHLNVEAFPKEHEEIKPVRGKVKTVLEFFNPWLFGFMDKAIKLEHIDENRTHFMNSNDIMSMKIRDQHSVELLVNLQKINDIRRINRYFIEVHQKMLNGGYFVGFAKTKAAHRKVFFDLYDGYFPSFLYALHFLIFRIIPKLPVVKKFYFAVTRGRNRMISKAELLGRLSFCGFEILGEEEYEGSVYFVTRKMKTISHETDPSYGPLIKLTRTGLNGLPISVYKFRTMYPYSEFLQDYIYATQKLQEGGKFNNDFRVTEWGKFMRKFWLDELPMFYNWLRGDLQIVGIRPLSSQYICLYDEKLVELRERVKPGLLPPFYADMPKTIEEICVSEEKYIQKYMKNPLKTQCTYFLKIVYNISLKGARSR